MTDNIPLTAAAVRFSSQEMAAARDLIAREWAK